MDFVTQSQKREKEALPDIINSHQGEVTVFWKN
jgi:hypothetical protein